MSRRKQSSLEDLIEIASYMPWWAGLLLAIISYFLLDLAAGYTGNKIWETLLLVLKYFFLIGFTIGAIISAVKQWKRESIFNKQTGIESIRNLSWNQFELLINEAFKRQGYTVRETEFGPDGGVDLILIKDDRKLFVQCKQWLTRKVSVKQIRELQGVISAKNADGGIFVTSGIYTKEAIDFARECKIQLIEGNDLNDMFKDIDVEDSEPTVIRTRPTCPNCGSRMVKRTTRQGVNTGKEFWGCSTFPKCRGVINIKQD
jgi:restriction system protein